MEQKTQISSANSVLKMRYPIGLALALSAFLHGAGTKSLEEHDSLIIDDKEKLQKSLSPGQYLEVKLENINEM